MSLSEAYISAIAYLSMAPIAIYLDKNKLMMMKIKRQSNFY